jgi:F-type H+-transporting ATPase subunit gamma
MSNLKALRIRINSVKNTRKITSAMKMVAAAKLKRAQDQAEQSRPYAERLEGILSSLAANLESTENTSLLLHGTGKDETHLLVVVSTDKGLCGGFNTAIVRQTRLRIQNLQAEGKHVKILCVGKKARDVLARQYHSLIIKTIRDIGRPKLQYQDAVGISETIQELLNTQQFDVCTVIYNHFRSVISQVVTLKQLIPLSLPANQNDTPARAEAKALYLFEPSKEEIIETLLPKNLAIQLYKILMESAASEHGARMSAMDNATRNAGDMIKGLTLTYNRNRQAVITKELIEIISGAEAL